MLLDNYNRQHTYLRIALTDTCNFRCTYCMPTEDMSFMPHSKLMSATEIASIARVFVNEGVTKIRLTGGEPLMRKDFPQILEQLSIFPVEISFTSNGLLIDKHIEAIKKAGIRSLNISLDSLNAKKFYSITKRNGFDKVWSNILLLLENNIYVKLNVVAMKGVNDDEINDFIALTKHLPIHVRFIEFMPFTGNKWDKEKVLTTHEIISKVEEEFSFIKMNDKAHETSKKYKPLGHQGTFAIITTMSQPFCSDCNRLRLTADGKIKNCLFSAGEADILTAYRNGDNILPIIKQCVASKKKERGGQFQESYSETDSSTIINRSMVKIGG